VVAADSVGVAPQGDGVHWPQIAPARSRAVMVVIDPVLSHFALAVCERLLTEMAGRSSRNSSHKIPRVDLTLGCDVLSR
jgi:hypothetical protein